MATPTSLDTYTPLVGHEFSLQLDGGASRPLTLSSAKSRIEDELQTVFSLLFLQADGEPLPQGIYRLRHVRLGEIELFIVPLGKKRSGITYEAVFNLLKDEAPL